ncbi:uncharacterized protein [Rutidosis leptorrhynchoides]|uniref:uncharacterized protein isoform X2 n=1 Tax=Rutidosis leptorrhynchoides TaxID=125765 RepID=UPI003A9A3698
MNNHRTSFVKTFQNVEEQVSSPFNAQIQEFCESELFLVTKQSSELSFRFNCCYDEQSSYTKRSDLVENATYTTAIAPIANDISLIFEEDLIDNDISNFSKTSHFTNHQYPFSNQDRYDTSMLQNKICHDPMFAYPCALSNDHVVPKFGPTSFTTFGVEDDTSSILPFRSTRTNKSLSSNYSFVDSTEGFGTNDENSFLTNDIQTRDQEFTGESDRIFCNDPLLHSHNANKLEQYECRKTLADSRPRIRGRFVRNDEFGENLTTDNREEYIRV